MDAPSFLLLMDIYYFHIEVTYIEKPGILLSQQETDKLRDKLLGQSYRILLKHTEHLKPLLLEW